MVLKSQTLSVSIGRTPKQVYGFVSDPENFPKWATAFCRSVRRSRGDWIVETPDGPMKVRFEERNKFGILDHVVSPAPGVEILVPMRVMPNGSGSEVVLTVFQRPGMSDEKFAEDAGMVRRDLGMLKTVLEG